MKKRVTLLMALGLMAFFQVAHTQEFDQLFDTGVMRIDLVFSGTADETSYALSGVKKEQFYSGSRTRLIDPFDYGDHKFVVKD
ncbi:MAG: peptidase M64 N-terminal domain-containing protein, partial [Bacteroidota bacterium]|nr:peptidase M64 N-terminal domain-containing protein [Bacteroidota bacterium]